MKLFELQDILGWYAENKKSWEGFKHAEVLEFSIREGHGETHLDIRILAGTFFVSFPLNCVLVSGERSLCFTTQPQPV